MKEKHVSTALVFTLVAIVLYLIYRHIYFLYGGLVFGCIGLFFRWLSEKIHQGWMFIAEMIGAVMSKVILTVVYFIFLVPLAFMSKLFRKTAFDKSPQSESYFTERMKTYTPADLQDPW
jgi:hypothetical protein